MNISIITQGQGTTPVTVVLCGVSLGYATNEASDPFALVPLKPVKYVERCDCPPNREGPLCENCSPGYTTDPSLGGEFAHCVRCFCNYHSSSCDPNTGECFNCSDNTEGPDCERCISGYFRNTSLRTDSCILCECSVSGTVGGACRAVSTEYSPLQAPPYHPPSLPPYFYLPPSLPPSLPHSLPPSLPPSLGLI